MNAGQRTWLRWSQVRNPRRINRTAPMVKSPPHHPQPSPRASRPSFRGSDGRRSRKPGARACRCGQSNGSWASTGPPSGVIWRPEVLQDGSSVWCPIRRHRIPWQRNGVTFSLNTYPDIFPDLRQPQPDDRAAHVVHFTAAVYTLLPFGPRDISSCPLQCQSAGTRTQLQPSTPASDLRTGLISQSA